MVLLIFCRIAKILKYSNIPAILALTENPKFSLSTAKQSFEMTSSYVGSNKLFTVKKEQSNLADRYIDMCVVSILLFMKETNNEQKHCNYHFGRNHLNVFIVSVGQGNFRQTCIASVSVC